VRRPRGTRHKIVGEFLQRMGITLAEYVHDVEFLTAFIYLVGEDYLPAIR
jgi:hypothetical protein